MKRCSSHQALERLRCGKPLVVSTDTVYGLGVSVAHCPSPEELFRIKKRDHAKPIAWLMADASDLAVYGERVPGYAKCLARDFWPGALTLIVRGSSAVPSAYAAEDGSIALRVPDAPELRALMRDLGSALATSSANVSGHSPATSLGEVDPAIAQFAPECFLSEVAPSGQASTIVDCRGEEPVILRQGDISSTCIAASIAERFE